VSREVGAVLLGLLGGAILRISIGDAYLRYVKEGLRPWLLVSGSVLVVLALLMMLDVVREARRARDADPDQPTDGAHVHAHAEPWAAWLLVLPVLAIYLIAPPALGAFTAERQAGTVVTPSSNDPWPALPEVDPVPISLGEYASRAVWGGSRTLEGRTVELTGFVSAREGEGWYLTRLSLSCCAADAYATKVEVRDAPFDPPSDTWLKVTGTFVPIEGEPTSSSTAVIRVTQMTEVPPPDIPYE